MIYTVTLNPSLDYVVEGELLPGCVNRARRENIYPGGKGINVSLVLRQLGMETMALGFVAGHIGGVIEALLYDLDCPHKLLKLRDGESRINVKYMGQQETAINGCGPTLGEEDLIALLEQLKDADHGDWVVLSGWSQHPSFVQSILKTMRTSGCRTVVDCSGEALLQSLQYRPYLIKPNLQELGEVFNRRDLSFPESVMLAKELQDRGARNVLLTMGAEGAFLLTEAGELYTAASCPGEVRSTVGAGDATVAGFLTGLGEEMDLPRGLQMAVAAGCATAYTDWLGERREIMELVESIRVQKLPLQ